MLRAHACVTCGDPIPPGRRLDRRYCKVSCRSVAYRARKSGTATLAPARQAGPGEAVPPSFHGCIPSEVLDILAKHFHARDLELHAQRATVHDHAEPLSHVRTGATAPDSTDPSESPTSLLAAQERIHKLTDALARSENESADKYGKLTSRFDTLNRQKQTVTDQLAQQEQALQTLRDELQETRGRLADAAAQAKQLEDVQRALETEQQRAGSLAERATTWEREAAELEKSCTEASVQTRRDADQLSAQAARITKLEAQLRDDERSKAEGTDAAQATHRAADG